MLKSSIKFIAVFTPPYSRFALRLRKDKSPRVSRLWSGYVSQTPFAATMNDVLHNFGDKVVRNTLDPNRFFEDVNLLSHPNAQLDYTKHQRKISGNNYFPTHAIRLFVFHSLDFGNKN
jgi:hypothetical protein